MFNVWCEGVQYGGLRGIMRHLEHLPRYSATFTSIHIVSTLILDVREFILDFFGISGISWDLAIFTSIHIVSTLQCIDIGCERILFHFWNILRSPRPIVGLKRMKYSIPLKLLFQEKTLNFVSSMISTTDYDRGMRCSWKEKLLESLIFALMFPKIAQLGTCQS